MVALSRLRLLLTLALIVFLAVILGFWQSSRTEPRHRHVGAKEGASVLKPPSRSPAPEVSLRNGNLKIASPTIEMAMNEARWPSTSRVQNSTPADTFVNSLSALARGDIRTFALAMSRPAQAAFLEGRSIDDPYFQTLPQKVAEVGFQSLTVESFEAERTDGICKLTAVISSIRGKQKIHEEIVMELFDSNTGWLIEKYDSRIVKHEAIVQDK